MNIIKTILLAFSLFVCTLSFADSGSRKEAEALLDVVGMQNVLEQSIEQMVEIELKQTPALAPYKQVMLKFFGKYMNYASLKPDLVNIYAEAFTEAELKEINAFYKTPTGKKTIQRMPTLMSQAAQLGMQRVQDNLPEFQQMIKAESERLKKLQSK